MDRMLVVVFDNETKVYEGKKALMQLDEEGSVTVYGYSVLVKQADGRVSVRDGHDVGAIGTLAGTSLGSLIGLLGGPTGVAIGAAVGLTGGSLFDVHNARVGTDYLDDVSSAIAPNKGALVAQVDEEWTTPVDTRMEQLGG